MHVPRPSVVTPATRNALIRAIRDTEPHPRTGAAFVSVDTRVLATLVHISRTVCETIQMSDPEHENFADSGADCLQHLLEQCERWLPYTEAAESA